MLVSDAFSQDLVFIHVSIPIATPRSTQNGSQSHPKTGLEPRFHPEKRPRSEVSRALTGGMPALLRVACAVPRAHESDVGLGRAKVGRSHAHGRQRGGKPARVAQVGTEFQLKMNVILGPKCWL